jgi:hypothetical protein
MQRGILVTMKILLSSWYYLENLTKLFHMLWNFKFDVIFIMYLLANIIIVLNLIILCAKWISWNPLTMTCHNTILTLTPYRMLRRSKKPNDETAKKQRCKLWALKRREIIVLYFVFFFAFISLGKIAPLIFIIGLNFYKSPLCHQN